VRGSAPSKQAVAAATPPRPPPSTSSSAPSPSSSQPALTTASTSFSQLSPASSTAAAARVEDMTEGLRLELANETARRADNEMLIRELTTTNDGLNKRNGELEVAVGTLNKRNGELEVAVGMANMRTGELEVVVEALEKQNNAALDELNRKNNEFVLCIEAANKSNSDLATQLTAMKSQLEQERLRRMAVESRLNRLLYGNFEDISFNQSLSHLLLCCDTVPDVSLEHAILGNGTNHGSNCLRGQVVRGSCTEDYIRSLISINRNELQDLPMTPTILGSPTNVHITLEHLLAIRMYTFGNDRFKLYVAVNAPFYDPNRTTDSLANQLPFVRLLIRSLRALGRATKFETGITVYRGASVENSPYLQQVYDSFLNNTSNNNLRPGILFRFPSFTSTSTDIQEAMAQFGDDFVYEIRLKHEVCVASILYARLNYALYIVRLAWTSAPSAVSQPKRRCY
jgi:hypothetical protein